LRGSVVVVAWWLILLVFSSQSSVLILLLSVGEDDEAPEVVVVVNAGKNSFVNIGSQLDHGDQGFLGIVSHFDISMMLPSSPQVDEAIRHGLYVVPNRVIEWTRRTTVVTAITIS
jgi:hypothetical protein